MSQHPAGIAGATRSFFSLSAGEAVSRVIAAITVIYVARTLGVTSYGVVGVAAAIVLYFAVVVDWGIESFGPRTVAEKGHRLDSMVSSVLATRLAIATGFCLLLLLLGPLLLPSPEAQLLSLYGLTLLAAALNTRWVYVGMERTGFVAVARILSEAVKAVVLFSFLRDSSGVFLVPLAHFAGELAAAVLLLVRLRYRADLRRFRFDPAIVRQVFRQSMPLMLTALLGMAIYNIDLVFIRVFRGPTEVGYYLAAFTLVSFLSILSTAIRLSLISSFTRLRRVIEHQQELLHAGMVRLFAIGLPIAVGGCLLSSKIIGFVFGSDYDSSTTVLQVLILSIPVLFLRSVLQAVLIAVGQQTRVLRMTGLAASLNVLLNLLVVPIYGMTGAAITTVLTEIARFLLAEHYVRLGGFSPTSYLRYWRAAAASTVMALALLLAAPVSLWLGLVLGVVAYTLGLVLTGGLRFRRGASPAFTP